MKETQGWIKSIFIGKLKMFLRYIHLIDAEISWIRSNKYKLIKKHWNMRNIQKVYLRVKRFKLTFIFKNSQLNLSNLLLN